MKLAPANKVGSKTSNFFGTGQSDCSLQLAARPFFITFGERIFWAPGSSIDELLVPVFQKNSRDLKFLLVSLSHRLLVP